MEKKNLSKPTVGGLFSGVGGIELGFKKAGFEILWGNEIDKHCAVTYRANFKHRLYEKDIRELRGSDIEPVDVLCGGFPCQAFSVAGYRKGFKDDRGNIFFEIIRLIDELKKKPKVLFLENVKNLRGHDKGKTFQIICDTILNLGYSVFFDVLNTADYTNIPQNRERTFIICFKDEKDWDFFNQSQKSSSYKFSKLFPPKKTLKTYPIKDFLEECNDERYFYRKDKYMYDALNSEIKREDTVYQWRRIYVRENKNNHCPTLTANMGTGGHNVPLIKTSKGIRKLTPRECFSFQGFPKAYKLPAELPNTQLYKQAGNAVTVELIKKLAQSIKYSIA